MHLHHRGKTFGVLLILPQFIEVEPLPLETTLANNDKAKHKEKHLILESTCVLYPGRDKSFKIQVYNFSTFPVT